MIKAIAKIRHKEAGMAVLQLVLLLVMVGGLMLPPLLSLMMTASKAGQMEERKTQEFYSADAGVNAALWRIGIDGGLNWLNGKWNELVYAHNPAYENYTLSSADPVNGNSVVYQITPKWILEGLETPNGTQKRDPADNINVYGSYVGTGSQTGRGKYKISIYYDGNAGALGVSRIGYWLPRGFDYVGGPSSVEDNVTNPLHSYLVGGHPVVADFRGGHSIKWSFSSPVDFNLFTPGGTQKDLYFEFTPDQVSQGEFCWLADNITSNYLAWNNVKIFQVTSTATSPTGENTTVTSYSTRNDGQAFGAAMNGDYYAFGCTLMRDSDSSDQTHRDRLYKETSSTVSVIPANAQVEHIFLYWTGWKCKPWTTTDPTGKKVDSVTCNITVSGVKFSNIIASTKTQAMLNEGGSHGWSYSCFADITDRVKNYFNSQGVAYVGNGTYTAGHADFYPGTTAPATGGPWYRLYSYNSAAAYPYSSESVVGYTRYPLGSPRNGGSRDSTTSPYNEEYSWSGTSYQDAWAYAAWSIIIVYTSPATLGRQLYRFDDFYYGAENSNLTKTISGFLIPDLTSETNAAKMTCFVGEGDDAYTGDSIVVNGYTMPSDSTNPSNNVWNSKSYIGGQTVTGIDIDTWNLDKAACHLSTGVTTATVQLPTGTDSWNLVYMILSFRSKITAGGTFIYDIQ